MKKIQSIISFIVLSMIAGNSESASLSHFVVDSMRLRTAAGVSAPLVTTLPQYTAVNVVEEGKIDTIDGKTSPWVKIVSQTGFSGWCFSGYLKLIEGNIADDLAVSFAKRKDGTYPGSNLSHGSAGVSSIDMIRAATGFYIQQDARSFQEPGHAPEILQLLVSNDKVFIREVDILKNRILDRKETELRFNGSTYAHGKTKLGLEGKKILIQYMESVPEKQWLGTWDCSKPYTLAGTLNAPVTDKVYRLSSDYLSTFEGQYGFDSYKVVASENQKINANLLSKTVINIKYDPTKKCLTVPIHELIDFYEENNGVGDFQLDFVETVPSEPFFWSYGEGVGFSEDRFFFYKGGVAFTYEYKGYDFKDDGDVSKSKYIKYTVFFRKAI